MRRWARCPECGVRYLPVWGEGAREVYPAHHRRVGHRGTAQRCNGSGWLVEDEDYGDGAPAEATGS